MFENELYQWSRVLSFGEQLVRPLFFLSPFSSVCSSVKIDIFRWANEREKERKKETERKARQ